jgi:hypothetical protein
MTEIKVVGEYSHRDSDGNIPACFYYSHGNVILIFDYTSKCRRYFTENPEILRNARKIVFCFSGLHYNHSELSMIISLLASVHRVTCPIHIITPNKDNPGRYYKSVLVRRNHEWVRVICTNAKGANMISTNDCPLMLKPSGECVENGYLSFSVWLCKNGMWEMEIFYNGLSGDLDLSTLIGLSTHPNTKIFYYINHGKTEAKSLDNKKCKERILNTFDDLSNPLMLLGFKDKVEREYLVGELSNL